MLNTLNAPVEYLNKVTQLIDDDAKEYGQYISELRPEVGLQWKINKQHSLTLSYRYNYIYDRGINIDDTTGDITLTNKYTTTHLMLLTYKFGW